MAYGDQYQRFFDENRARRHKEAIAQRDAQWAQERKRNMEDALWKIANGCENPSTCAYNAYMGYYK